MPNVVPCSQGAFQTMSTGAFGVCVSKSIRSVISNVIGERTGMVSDSASRMISGFLFNTIISLLTE